MIFIASNISLGHISTVSKAMAYILISQKSVNYNLICAHRLIT